MIPFVASAVNTAAYNPKSNIAGFQIDGLRIIIGPEQMNIYGTDDEVLVRESIEWLISEIEKQMKDAGTPNDTTSPGS